MLQKAHVMKIVHTSSSMEYRIARKSCLERLKRSAGKSSWMTSFCVLSALCIASLISGQKKVASGHIIHWSVWYVGMFALRLLEESISKAEYRIWSWKAEWILGGYVVTLSDHTQQTEGSVPLLVDRKCCRYSQIHPKIMKYHWMSISQRVLQSHKQVSVPNAS